MYKLKEWGAQVSVKSSKAWLRYEKNKHTKKLNHKPMLGVSKNKGLEKQLQLKYFEVKGSTLKGCRRTVTLPIELNFTTWIVHNTKVLVLK